MSINYPQWAFNLAMLLMRVSLSVIMMPHGHSKFVNYTEKSSSFKDFMGLGGPTTLALVIFAELVCSGFVALGLFTRLAVIPLIINMSVALIQVHNADFLGEGQLPALFLTGYIVILLLGPGKISADNFVK